MRQRSTEADMHIGREAQRPRGTETYYISFDYNLLYYVLFHYNILGRGIMAQRHMEFIVILN